MATRAYRLRVYLTAEQEALAQRCADHLRWVWNHTLRRRSLAYRRRKESVTGVDLSRELTRLKKLKRFAWLNEIPSTVIAQRLRDQDRAFANFFEGRAGYPRFRKRRHRTGRVSMRFQLDQRQIDRMYAPSQGILKLPRFGNLEVRWSRIPEGKPKMVTLSRNAVGRWFVSMAVEEPVSALPKSERRIGLDRGLKHLLVASDGWTADNPRHINRHLRRLKRESRRLSRKQKGSGRWHRQARVVARVHARIADARRDYLHQISWRLMSDSQTIALEDLNVQGMMRNKRLARAIGDAAWSELARQLAYKAGWYGREVLVIDRFAPSSKQCSSCGHRLDSLDLQTREWTCPGCRTHHDRDENAAKNILHFALLGQAPVEPAEAPVPRGARDLKARGGGQPSSVHGHECPKAATA